MYSINHVPLVIVCGMRYKSIFFVYTFCWCFFIGLERRLFSYYFFCVFAQSSRLFLIDSRLCPVIGGSDGGGGSGSTYF